MASGSGGRARPRNTSIPSRRELRAILESAATIDPAAAVFFRLWAQTGLRSGEIRGLWRGDLDLVAGVVHVQRSRTKRRVGLTKTGRTRLVSVLHPVCEDTPAWQPGATPESRSVLAGLQRSSSPVWNPMATCSGGASMSTGCIGSGGVLTKAGVHYREVEQVRHTFASTLLSRNAPLLYVAQQGGWKNAGVLLKHYARWMPQVTAQPATTQAQPWAPDARQMRTDLTLGEIRR